ncbi:hypothetical protein B0H13DRAFT_2274855, partial [Mycena leptocephala]
MPGKEEKKERGKNNENALGRQRAFLHLLVHDVVPELHARCAHRDNGSWNPERRRSVGFGTRCRDEGRAGKEAVHTGESNARSRTRTAARLEMWEGAKTDLLVPDATSTVPVNDTRSGASMRSIHGSALARACATGITTPERSTALQRAGRRFGDSRTMQGSIRARASRASGSRGENAHRPRGCRRDATNGQLVQTKVLGRKSTSWLC